jgi:hypothetical protein
MKGIEHMSLWESLEAKGKEGLYEEYVKGYRKV